MFMTRKWATLAALGLGPLMATTGEGGAGGAGGGGGGGGTGGNVGSGIGTFTQDQLDVLDQRIGNMVNGLFTRKAAKLREEMSMDFAKTLDEKLAAFKPKAGDDEPGDKGAKGGKGRNEDVEFQTIKRALETQKGELELIKQERDRERATNRNNALTGTIREQLAKHGIVDPVDQSFILAKLRADKTVDYEDDDANAKPVWRSADGSAVDVEMGFRLWAKTPEAKRFLPATGTRGSGSQRGTGTVNGQTDPTQVESNVWSDLAKEL